MKLLAIGRQRVSSSPEIAIQGVPQVLWGAILLPQSVVHSPLGSTRGFVRSTPGRGWNDLANAPVWRLHSAQSRSLKDKQMVNAHLSGWNLVCSLDTAEQLYSMVPGNLYPSTCSLPTWPLPCSILAFRPSVARARNGFCAGVKNSSAITLLI